MIAQRIPGHHARALAQHQLTLLPADSRLVEGGGLVDALKIKCLNRLRLSVLQNREVFRGKPLHRRTRVLVAHHHIRQHQVALHLQYVTGVVRMWQRAAAAHAVVAA